MPVDNVSIGRKIRKIRKENNLSQEEFAKLFGMNQQNVSRYENGNYQIPYTDLANIAVHFHISTDYFFDIEVEKVREDEWSLLAYYRSVNQNLKPSAVKLVRALAEEFPKDEVRV